ncbi:alcohol acyltransferase 9-like [Vicia villosa]|uniref:alcohol acyltransferase 9-like n=1 Tax=Vicia villosa TaxID=3911 RepID=UPI00273C77F9|nr:alcohol acyltransferase 9-like [Vicia villosa]
MSKSIELPNCTYPCEPVTIIPPSAPTPKHSLYLSNLDDQKFLRFSIKYVYIFKKLVNMNHLKSSLARVLVDYYPLAGRLRRCSSNLDDDGDDEKKLEVDCNGKGGLFVEAFMDITADELVEHSKFPNKSWRKFLYKVESQSFLDVPPLIVQLTSLSCGGMILCTAINHALCDGVGTSQFLHAWAHLTTSPQTNLTIQPFHSRHVLHPRQPPTINLHNPAYTRSQPNPQINLHKSIQSQPLVPTSFTFNSTHIVYLKKQCIPSLKCTTFEIIAAHTWRSWIRSLNLPLPYKLNVKLLFSVNFRSVMNLPKGYYGNGFLLACAESKIEDLVGNNNNNLHYVVKLVQKAKSTVNDEEYIRSTVDLLEDKTVKTDVSTSLVISQWSKLGLEDVDFGEGKALHMGPLTSDVYCLFLPVIGGGDGVRVVVSVPESMVESFEYQMSGNWEKKMEDEDMVKNGFHANEISFL